MFSMKQKQSIKQEINALYQKIIYYNILVLVNPQGIEESTEDEEQEFPETDKPKTLDEQEAQ